MVKADRELSLSEPTREELYAAKLCHRIFEVPFMVWGKESGIDEDKHIIKFTLAGRPTEESEEDEEKVAEAASKLAEQSWAVWSSVLGDGKNIKLPDSIDPESGLPKNPIRIAPPDEE